jgi:hypothetical protein
MSRPKDAMGVVRYVILALSAAAAVCGVLIMAGLLVPVQESIPDQYRIIIGAVVTLYGIYRFVVAYIKPTRP